MSAIGQDNFKNKLNLVVASQRASMVAHSASSVSGRPPSVPPKPPTKPKKTADATPELEQDLPNSTNVLKNKRLSSDASRPALLPKPAPLHQINGFDKELNAKLQLRLMKNRASSENDSCDVSSPNPGRLSTSRKESIQSNSGEDVTMNSSELRAVVVPSEHEDYGKTETFLETKIGHRESAVPPPVPLKPKSSIVAAMISDIAKMTEDINAISDFDNATTTTTISEHERFDQSSTTHTTPNEFRHSGSLTNLEIEDALDQLDNAITNSEQTVEPSEPRGIPTLSVHPPETMTPVDDVAANVSNICLDIEEVDASEYAVLEPNLCADSEMYQENKEMITEGHKLENHVDPIETDQEAFCAPDETFPAPPSASLLLRPEAKRGRKRERHLMLCVKSESSLSLQAGLKHLRPMKAIPIDSIPAELATRSSVMKAKIESFGGTSSSGFNSKIDRTANWVRNHCRANSLDNTLSVLSSSDSPSTFYDSNYISADDDETASDKQRQAKDGQQAGERNVSDEKEAKRKNRQKLALNAIVTTEEKYVSDLKMLTKQLPEYIAECNKSNPEPIVPDSLVKQIKKNLGSILELHQHLLDRLKRCIGQSNLYPDVDDEKQSAEYCIPLVLKQYAPFMKCSKQFLNDKDLLVAAVAEARKKYPEFAKHLAKFEAENCKNLPLSSYFDVVHQRICRYPLMLIDYKSYLIEGSLEQKRTQEALIEMKDLATKINSSVADADRKNRMFEIQERLGKQFDILAQVRILIKEGEIHKQSRKEIHVRILFLFSDVLLYCSTGQPPASTVNLRQIIPLTEILEVQLNPHEAHMSEFSILAKQRSLTLIAIGGPEKREEWSRAIVKAVHDAREVSRRRSFSKLPRGATIDQCAVGDDFGVPAAAGAATPNLPGVRAALWLPDASVTMCQFCNDGFNVFKRRHHCRSCGKVMCDKCSGRAPIEYLNFKSKRVCPVCYDALFKIVPERFAEKCRLAALEEVEGSMEAEDGAPQSPRLSAIGRSATLGDGAARGKTGDYGFHKPKFQPPQNRLVGDLIATSKRRGGSVASLETNESTTSTLLRSGFLDWKVDEDAAKWRRVWVTLQEDTLLQIYGAEKDKNHIKKMILLGCQVETVECTAGVNIISIYHTNQISAGENTRKTIFVFKAENSEIASKWTTAINQALSVS